MPEGARRVVLTLPLANLPPLAIDRIGDGQYEGVSPPQQQVIVEAPPSVVSVRQLVSAYRESAGDIQDPATYGLLVGVLFDKPVTRGVGGTQDELRHRGEQRHRRAPAVERTPRRISISSVPSAGSCRDRCRSPASSTPEVNVLSASTTPIAMALFDGARVFGQVRTSDGRGVPSSVLTT